MLSIARQQQVIRKTDHLIASAAEHYQMTLKPLPVTFDINGQAWGYYVRKGRKACIRYNPWLFAEYFHEGLHDTVPHEVAHYVVDKRYHQRCKPHGPEWRDVMHFFGIQKPRATAPQCHNTGPIRRQLRHHYQCSCRSHDISTTRHNRIQKGVQYLCRACGGMLFPVNNDPSFTAE